MRVNAKSKMGKNICNIYVYIKQNKNILTQEKNRTHLDWYNKLLVNGIAMVPQILFNNVII